MAKGVDVLRMLCPEGGWIIVGDDYEGITWVDGQAKCTKAEFTAGFKTADAFFEAQEQQKIATRQAILDRLGITAEEALILLG